MNTQHRLIGKTGDGREVEEFILSNDDSMTVRLMTYGGIISSIRVPDKTGKIADVVLGFNTLEEYLQKHPHFGVIVGRYANRIAKGQFSLDGKVYSLARNDGKNHIHGGITGFDRVVWTGSQIQRDGAVGVELTYLSKDGEEGYPGNLHVTVRYLLTRQNELVIEYEAVTDQPTVVNLTNHSYFNLAGEGSGDVLNHEIMIHASQYTEVDDELIPTGELKPVAGSAMDFRTTRPIGSRLNELRNGYDHNYILDKASEELSLAAEVVEPISSRVMEVYTTEPGMQFYTGNFLDGTFRGKSGQCYGKHGGFCLETQHYPDSPNHPHFPTTRLNPGDKYKSKTIYKFSVKS